MRLGILSILTVLVFLLFISACQLDNNIDANPINNSKDNTTESKNVEIFDNLNEDLILTENVEYFDGVNGFLARPKSDGIYPGVILIHEWWGLNDNIKTMAKLLAQEGYVVLAVYLYGEIAVNSTEAQRLSGIARANPQESVNNMKSAVAYLRSLQYVDDNKIGSLGWCFGGGQSLQLALSGENMTTTVIYYGNLVNDTENLSKISWPVLGIFGENDTGIPPSAVNAFGQSLDELNITNEIYIYPGVGHAFANPSGARYAPSETIDAWEKTLNFLEKYLK